MAKLEKLYLHEKLIGTLRVDGLDMSWLMATFDLADDGEIAALFLRHHAIWVARLDLDGPEDDLLADEDDAIMERLDALPFELRDDDGNVERITDLRWSPGRLEFRTCNRTGGSQ
jgi:hypothetical protein